MNFADRLHARIKSTGSPLVAGFDPRPAAIPKYFHTLAQKHSQTNQQYIFKLFTEFHAFCLSVLAEKVAAIKPNLAFFEAFGIAGLEAYVALCKDARGWQIPIIADGKRGDIGSTAEAYAQAFLGGSKFNGYECTDFQADALTVNPFLGFDTLEPFVQACKDNNAGIFVLVKTSNSGSADIQGQNTVTNSSISNKIAEWLHEKGQEFKGSSGYSSLGAVVGATYPAEAKILRQLMPNNIFLIPGVGSQGGSMQDAKAGFGADGFGAVVNVSRGLLGNFTEMEADLDGLRSQLVNNINSFL